MDEGDDDCAKPDVKPRQLLSTSSGVVRLGAAVASDSRHMAPHLPEKYPSWDNIDGNCGVSPPKDLPRVRVLEAS